jgi:hypothetical protein
MAWITLTEADALTVVNAKLLDAARTKALAAGQADPLAEKLSQAIGRVRGAIGASGKYTLGAGETIPSRLKQTTLDLFAVPMLARLDVDPEKGKVMLYESAEAVLNDVKNGKFDIDEALTPTEETSSGSYTPEVCGRERQWGRDAQDGA